MKKIPIWLIITVVVALLSVSKFIFFNKKTAEPVGAQKGKSGMPVSVNFYVAQRTEFSNEISATGKIGALNHIEMLPEVSGKITGVFFKEGESVDKGALLVKLNDADLQAQRLKTQTQLRLSEQKLERLKKLLTINGISQEEFDMQENEVMALKADATFVEAQLAKTNIVAPFSGVVGLKNISIGSYVNATTPIVSLVQMKPLFVEFSLPEKYISRFKKGLTIEFYNDNAGAGEKKHVATIFAIEPRVDETTKTIKARAMYNGEKIFYPGSFVHVSVQLGKTENALMIPTAAVIPTSSGQKVYLGKNNVATEVPVEIGMRTAGQIEILKGLKPGDTIITTGLMMLKNNSKVKLLMPQK